MGRKPAADQPRNRIVQTRVTDAEYKMLEKAASPETVGAWLRGVAIREAKKAAEARRRKS